MTNQEKYQARLKRVTGAIAMEKTDRIPCVPFIQTFPYLRQGHTMAQIVYDVDMASEDNLKYHVDFEPDMSQDFSQILAGEGPLLERLGLNYMRWAGQPGVTIDQNSIHQFIEKPYLEDDEYPEILTDYSSWVLNKLMPRMYRSMECFAELNIPSMVRGKPGPGMRQFRNPKIAETFAMLSEVAQGYAELERKTVAHNRKLADAGFPSWSGRGCTTAFDALSDSLRGTLDVMMDLIERPDEVLEAVDMFHKRNVAAVRAQLANPGDNRFIFIPMHKGFDGFMSPAQYEQFYYPTLKALVEEIIRCGGIPWVYTEGKYDSRLETLSDLPAGKVLLHIEDADMKEAKRILGKNHCLSGGFKSAILKTHTPDQIRDEVKRFLDVVAVDGGYIFDIDYTLDDVTDASVAAMFETVVQYGCY